MRILALISFLALSACGHSKAGDSICPDLTSRASDNPASVAASWAQDEPYAKENPCQVNFHNFNSGAVSMSLFTGAKCSCAVAILIDNSQATITCSGGSDCTSLNGTWFYTHIAGTLTMGPLTVGPYSTYKGI